MSSATTDFTEEGQHVSAQSPVALDYVPTEEEKRVFKECNRESLLYRAVPSCLLSVSITQALLAKGILSPSPRFGSLPKVVFAGVCGYIAGKISYMKVCQEKFKRLENSPLGEALRQRTGMPTPSSKGPQSEMSDPDALSFESMFRPADAAVQTPADSRDNEYGYNTESPATTRRGDNFNASVDNEEPRKKATLYEDLRLKNRENYEVTLTQKAETLLKSSPKKEPGWHNKDDKKNIYGDTWED
ncbi:OCIA domain-containing protein 1-like [Clinocottus analis]|uniref:OCIA domain-containing protein 1-like n=1 Tax=Clinocottus analis TaxID=304258 RepID=UPI0035BED080